MHASPTAKNFFLVLISTFRVYSHSFLPKPCPYFLIALVFANAFSRVGDLVHHHNRFMQVLSARGVDAGDEFLC